MNELKIKLCMKHTIVLCSHIVEELNRVTKRKFAHKLKDVDAFLTELPCEAAGTFWRKTKSLQAERRHGG